ncbi:MAG: hypothetical protein KDC98_02675 [Planctomycetes bacterium]|nr:hypothetical protein [Planctomycetota bacterium]
MVSSLCAAGLALALLAPQDPPIGGSTTSAPNPAAGSGEPSGIRYDANGYPIVPDEPAPRSIVPLPAMNPAPTYESRPGLPADGARRQTADVEAASDRRTSTASGMELGSPLLDVFQFTRSPGAFKALGGVQVFWRVTIFGGQGEVLGMREITQVADCSFAERDRLEYETDGRVYGRADGSAFAERQGMPWPSDVDRAGPELALFGMHLRAPWCFGDGISYVVLATDTVDRPGERLRRVLLERRPLNGSSLIGPELDPRPRDRFELVFEPGTGRPRELVHRFASSGLARRLVFEDWRDELGIRMPFRRIYVDETQKRTTMLEVLNVSRRPVTERMFRLH